MKTIRPRAIDTFESFTLLSDLSYSQNIVYNYAKTTLDKALAISKSMNFIARSAAQSAYKALEEKYNIIQTDRTGQITINYQFTPTLIEYKVKNGIGRPKTKLNTDATDGQLQPPTE